MMQAYFKNKNKNEIVVFDAFYRNNPFGNGYALCCGIQQVVDYIKNLRFNNDDLEYLRSLNIFDEDFIEYLAKFKFSSDVAAIRKALLFFLKNQLLKLLHLL